MEQELIYCLSLCVSWQTRILLVTPNKSTFPRTVGPTFAMDSKDKTGSLYHVGQSQGSRAATVASTRGGIIPEKCTEVESEGEKDRERWGRGRGMERRRKERKDRRRRKRDLSWDTQGFHPQ